MKRSQLFGVIASLVAITGFVAQAKAQPIGGGFYGASSEGLIDAGGVPGIDGALNPITAPLGDPGKPGFFTFFEATALTQSRTLGNQLVAWRGLQDSTGVITGLPGTFIGSGVRALSTDSLGRTSYAPGVNLGIGYKLDDGSTVHFRVLKSANVSYVDGASSAPQYGRSGLDLADTFLVSGVFNFPPQYAGPGRTTAFETTRIGDITDIFGNVILPIGRTVPEGAFYGIWNGAGVMTLEYSQDYTEVEFGGRVPLFESRTSKIYGTGGMRFHHFMERFKWRTTAFSFDGLSGDQFAAVYTNNLSQRLYGPYIGCAHDWYLGNKFSVSAEVNGGVFMNVIKERAKYKLADNSIQNKRSRNDIDLTPTAGGAANLWWYPTRGVQVRVGYMANTFYNTRNMEEPIDFNYGSVDPAYGRQYFRLIHGVQFGLSLFF